MRRKGLLAVVVSGLMAISPAASADRSDHNDPGGTFTDDDDSVHEGGIEAIADGGITLGCNPPSNYLYCHSEDVTRAQMATFIARALNLGPASEDYFVDDENVIHEGGINRIREAGITQGCNPPDWDEFCPHQTMTRGQMAAFFARAFEFASTDIDPFVDTDGHLFENAINKMAAAGVTQGCNPPDYDRFCPDDGVTRGQMATFLTRAIDDLSSLKPPDPTRVPVLSITDGDTIRVMLGGVDEPLRLIGIDSPEVGDACFDEATEAMTALVSGKTVRVDIDETDRDTFDRLLRYVFLTDGTFVNAEMVRMGWASAPESPPDNAFSGELSRVEDEAQAANRGIWGAPCAD